MDCNFILVFFLCLKNYVLEISLFVIMVNGTILVNYVIARKTLEISFIGYKKESLCKKP